MPIYRRRKTPSLTNSGDSNIVKLGNRVKLPYRMTSGEISWSCNLEDFPSGSLTYTGVLEQDLKKFEAAFDYLGEQKAIATIDGIQFYCRKPFSYQLNHYLYQGQDLKVYTINVGLVSIYADRARKNILATKVIPQAEGIISIAELADYVGVPYKGENFIVDLQGGVTVDTTINLFDLVSAEARVKGGYLRCEEGIELVSVDTGKEYTFKVGEVLNADGENSLGIPPAYRDAELTWNKDPLAPELELKEPKVETVVKQDVNPTLPPAADEGVSGTYILVDNPWSSLFVNGGPTKTRVTTTTIDGTPTKVVTEIFGYSFDSRDIDIDETKGEVLPSAENYWQVCETSMTEYVYTAFKNPRYKIKIKDLSDPSGTSYLTPVIHPDYKKFARVIIENRKDMLFEIDLGTEYLVQERTTGNKLFNFRREEGEARFEVKSLYEELLVETDPEMIRQLELALESYRQRWMPTESIKAYKLQNKRNLYRQFESELTDYEENFTGNPFNIETINYNALPQKIKAVVPEQGTYVTDEGKPVNLDIELKYIGYDGRVAVLTPDISFIEPFVVTDESYLKNSYAYNPTSNLFPDYDEQKPFQKDTTGEETYTRITRKVLGKNRYSQLTSEYSSGDSGFERSFNKITEEAVLGQLPDAQSRKKNWQDKLQKVRRRDETKKTRIFLESDRATEDIPSGESVNFPNATSRDEALLAAATDLRIKTWQTSNQSKNCTWYLPQLRPGDYIKTPNDLFKEAGDWRLLSASYNLSVLGDNNSSTLQFYPLALTSGTQISTGLDFPREILYREEPDVREKQLEADDTVVVLKGQTEFGEILTQNKTRRNQAPRGMIVEPTP